MVKILLKKQMMEMFRTYFYNQKKNTKRSKATTIMYIVLFALLLVVIFGGVFGFVAYLIAKPFCALELGWMYFDIMGLIAIALGAFGSVFNTYSGLYLAKDNDMLFSLPIPVSAIMASRLLGVYLMGLMYSGIVALTSVIVYLCIAGFTFKALICGLFYIFIISIMVLIFSCLLGWVVARISQKLKNKSFITVFVSLVGIGLYYFCYFKAQTVINNLIENALVYGQRIKGGAYIVYTFGRIAEGSGVATLCWLAAIGALFGLTWLLLQRSFLRVATGSSSSGASKKKSGSTQLALRARSVRGALFAKELARLTSSAGYMLNCALGSLFLLVLCITLAIKSDILQLLATEFYLPSVSVYSMGLFVICLVAGMNDIIEPSISLEGKNLWVLQTLPLDSWDVLKAKLAVHLLPTAIPATLCVITLTFSLHLSVIQLILGLLFVLSFVLLMAFWGLFLGLKTPNLTWTNELVPIKQSFGVMASVFGAWIYLGIIIGLYFALSSFVEDFLYLSICTVVTCILCLVLALWLRKKGTLIFSRL